MSHEVKFHECWLTHWPGASAEDVIECAPHQYELPPEIEKWFADKGIEPDLSFESYDYRLMNNDQTDYDLHVTAVFEDEADAREFEQTFPLIVEAYD